MGTLQTTNLTSVDLHGYSGINSVIVNATGGKYALSFDSGATYKAKTIIGYSEVLGTESLVPLLSSTTSSPLVVVSASTNSGESYGAFDRYYGSWGALAGTGWLKVEFLNTKVVKGYSLQSSGGDQRLKSPTAWTFEGSNDDLTWDILDTRSDPSIQTGWSYRSFNCSNNTAYKFYRVNITSAYNGQLEIAEFCLYEGTPYYGWQIILPSEIETRGMDASYLSALTVSDYSEVFQQTQLDILASLSSTDSLTSITVNLPENQAPVISDISISSSSVHKAEVDITAKITDPENGAINYRILINGSQFIPPILVPENGLVSIALPSAAFRVGVSTVEIEAQDDRGETSSSSITITKTNTIPVVISSVSGNIYTASLGDVDNDKVKYRLLFNGVEKIAWTELADSPVIMKYTIDRSDILFGKTNTVRIEFLDDLGEGGSSEITFIGSYYGLMFEDTEGKFYSSDLGEIIKKLDFGILFATQNSPIKEVVVHNTYGFDVSNVIVGLNPNLSTQINVGLSETKYPFDPVSTLNLGNIANEDKKSFYVQVSTTRESFGGGDFGIAIEASAV